MQVGAAGVLAAALGVSYCSHRSEGHSDDLPEAGDDMDDSSDSSEAGGEPISSNLVVKYDHAIAVTLAQTQAVRAEIALVNRAANKILSELAESASPELPL